MFMSTGAFIRGTFSDGLLNGNCYLRPNNEYAFLLRLTDGVLDSKSTVFDFSKDNLRVLNYTEGKCLGVAKDFERSADKCHKEIVQTLFGREPGTIRHYLELTNRIKNLPGNFFGTFALSEKVWFYGGFSNGAPNGLGVLIEMNSKVQIGFFENGHLSGFGRIMWTNGVVMDGMIKKSTINEEVIIYNQVAHEWTKAIFKDNSLFQEISKGQGYPRDIRADLFQDYFSRGYNKKANVSISADLFTQEIPQELLFHLIYGEQWNEKLPNNLNFSFSGENNIEFDSRKDISDMKNTHLINMQFQSPENIVQAKVKMAQPQPLTSNIEEVSQGNRKGIELISPGPNGGAKKLKSLPLKGPSQEEIIKQQNVMEERFQYSDGEEVVISHQVPQDVGIDQISSPESNRQGYHEEEGSPSDDKLDQQGLRGFLGQPEDPSAQKRVVQDGDKHRYPTPVFDRFDMLILQRAISWENDKTLNSKNKYSRKTLSNKTISEATKLNIVRNYVEDFMEAFLDKREIDRLMGGIEAYQVLKNKQ